MSDKFEEWFDDQEFEVVESDGEHVEYSLVPQDLKDAWQASRQEMKAEIVKWLKGEAMKCKYMKAFDVLREYAAMIDKEF